MEEVNLSDFPVILILSLLRGTRLLMFRVVILEMGSLSKERKGE